MILVTHFACCHQYKGYWRSCPLGWSYFTVMPGLNLRAGGAYAPEFTDEACEILRIGYNAMYELLSTGKLKAYRNGRVWRIPKVAVQDFILRQINSQS